MLPDKKSFLKEVSALKNNHLENLLIELYDKNLKQTYDKELAYKCL